MPDFEESIAHTAFGYVHGERAKTYGHPRFDFSAIAKVWTGLLQDVLKDDAKLDPYRVAILMTGLKLCRLVKSPEHKDSRVDTIGYMLTMERLDEVEEAPSVDGDKVKLTTIRPASPYAFPKSPLPNLRADAEREIDKLLELNTEFDNSVDGPLTSVHHPVNLVLRGFKPVDEIEWQEDDRLETWKSFPKRTWRYHDGNWYADDGSLHANSYCAYTLNYLRQRNAPLIVPTGTYKDLLLLKDGVGYVPE